MPTAPTEIWRYGGQAGAYGFARRADDAGYLVQVGRGLELRDEAGHTRWQHRTLGVAVVVEVLDFNGDGRLEALVTLGKKGFALLDVLTGRELWRWTSPPGTYLVRFQVLRQPGGARLIVFPPFCTLGYCFDFSGTGGVPRLLWQRDYQGDYATGYGPSIVLADMDNDGRPEIVLAGKPACIKVLDLDTGAIRFGVTYTVAGGSEGMGEEKVGRPYGLLQACDLDGDGFLDVVLVSTQVEEYLAVIRNDGGQALQPLWSQFVEKDFPTDRKEVRATTTSVADVNGDGRPELVLGLFNTEDDERWHTVVLDPLRGFHARLADWPDRYFRGCHAIADPGRPAIIVSPASTRSLASAHTLLALDGRTGAEEARLERARLVTVAESLYLPARPSTNERVYYGALQAPIRVTAHGRVKGLLVAREEASPSEGLWRIENGQTVVEPFAADAFARALLSSQNGDDWNLDALDERDAARRSAPPCDGNDKPAAAAAAPLVGMCNGRPELVLALADGTLLGGVPDFQQPGHFASAWQMRGVMPALWIGPEGERIVCAADPVADTLTWQQPEQTTPPVRIVLPLPLNRNASFSDTFPRASAWPLPFGAREPHCFVGFRLGEHKLACGVFDARGCALWVDAEHGPHPRAAAIACDADGRTDIVVDNHGRQYLYAADGRRRMIAHCWGDTIPGRGDGCAHALPIAGPFGPHGAPRIFMSPGYSALETLDGDGARLAQRKLANDYEFPARVAAVGYPRGVAQGGAAAGLVSELGVFHCVDLDTCHTRWSLDLNCPTWWPISVIAGDIDNDDRDEFLVGLPDGRVVALAETEAGGRIVWQASFEAGVLDLILADVDGDGWCELIVQTDDGMVRVLR